MNKELRDELHNIIGNVCSTFVLKEDVTKEQACIFIERDIKILVDNIYLRRGAKRQ
jgi:hypothetical protein